MRIIAAIFDSWRGSGNDFKAVTYGFLERISITYCYKQRYNRLVWALFATEQQAYRFCPFVELTHSVGSKHSYFVKPALLCAHKYAINQV